MNNIELKELFEAHMKTLKAEIRAGNDMLSYKVDEVISHQKTTNGRVNCLEDRFDKHDDCHHDLESRLSLWLWIRRNPGWSIAILIVLIIVVPVVVDKVGFEGIIKLIK